MCVNMDSIYCLWLQKTDLFELVADEGEGLEYGLGVAGHLKYQNINKIE